LQLVENFTTENHNLSLMNHTALSHAPPSFLNMNTTKVFNGSYTDNTPTPMLFTACDQPAILSTKITDESVTLEEQPKTQTIQGFNVTDATDVRNMNYKY
jgi:hypothetical protein